MKSNSKNKRTNRHQIRFFICCCWTSPSASLSSTNRNGCGAKHAVLPRSKPMMAYFMLSHAQLFISCLGCCAVPLACAYIYVYACIHIVAHSSTIVVSSVIFHFLFCFVFYAGLLLLLLFSSREKNMRNTVDFLLFLLLLSVLLAIYYLYSFHTTT